jgi:tetratricopeptide (TPR) repeat protein
MKWLSVMVVLLLALAGARAQGPDEQYIDIYNLIQQADGLNENGLPGEALPKYRQAEAELEQFQKGYPQWNPVIIKFRLKYVAGKIAEITAHAPAPATGGAGTNRPAPPSASVTPPAKAPPANWEAQLAALNGQVRQLQADKAELEAKLKEALAVRPAALDPRELAKAQDQIKALQKDNDLLKVTLAQEKAKAAPAPDTNALAEARQALTEANRKLADQTKAVNTLTREKQALSAEAEAAVALRAENQLLKKQLADLQAAPPPATQAEQASRQLAEARAQIAALQSDKALLQLEEAALENRVKQLSASQVAVAAPPAQTKAAERGRIKELEQERDELRKELKAANKQLYSRKGKALTARLESLESQLTTLRARLEVYEARQVPYSTEELALFKQPKTQLAQTNPPPHRAPVKALPPAAAALVAQANRYYADKQYDKAEKVYLQVLQQDNKNVATLANLAAIQLDLGHFDTAEINIKQALALAPDDSYSLLVLGRLRFRQKKYDEAIDALSRAAKLDPKNAEVQNFLGLALSEKGLRGPAEAALRKAVELDPDYADAHNNLAVVYITQQPPLVELARWHYQKALADGLARNPALEKMLNAKTPATSSQ